MMDTTSKDLKSIAWVTEDSQEQCVCYPISLQYEHDGTLSVIEEPYMCTEKQSKAQCWAVLSATSSIIQKGNAKKKRSQRIKHHKCIGSPHPLTNSAPPANEYTHQNHFLSSSSNPYIVLHCLT